ncbi:hypothetical protein Mpsy_2479 [Methanolobus psychrophilus R15]|nr:hypothetical protein Mpsy_2479 [Methanolobus psychrophilus R15]
MFIYRGENSAIFIHAVQTGVVYNCNPDRTCHQHWVKANR